MVSDEGLARLKIVGYVWGSARAKIIGYVWGSARYASGMVGCVKLLPLHHSAAEGSGTPKSSGQFYVKWNYKRAWVSLG